MPFDDVLTSEIYLIEVETLNKPLKNEFSLAELFSFKSLHPNEWSTNAFKATNPKVNYTYRSNREISYLVSLKFLSHAFTHCLLNQSGLFEVFRGFYLVILTRVVTQGLQDFISDLQHLLWVDSLWVNISWTCDEKAKLRCPNWRTDRWLSGDAKLKRTRAALRFWNSQFPPCPRTLDAPHEITIPSTIAWA